MAPPNAPPNWFCRSGGNGRVLRVEVVVRIEDVIAMELEQTAVHDVAAGLGGHIDQGRRLSAELRRVHRFLDFELLNRIDGRIDHQVIEKLVPNLGAVEQIDVVARSLPANIGQGTRLLQRVAARAARRKDDRIAERQGKKVPSVQRKLHDLAVLNDVAEFRGRRLQQRRSDGHGHRFGDAFDAEPELDVQGPADFEHDACLRLRREARQ